MLFAGAQHGTQRLRTGNAEGTEQGMATDMADVRAQYLVHQSTRPLFDAADIHHAMTGTQPRA